MLARAIERAGVEAPVTAALARLIEGTLPVDDWLARLRARFSRHFGSRSLESERQ